MKQCELCNNPARMHCESDQASLCWHCDAKVHSANFLVAKHSRCLLCRTCQAPTPWRADGPRLGPTVSLCLSCQNNTDQNYEQVDDADEESIDDVDDEDDDDDEEDEEEEEEGENQVVPWATMTPPPASSSSDDESSGGSMVLAKRVRDNGVVGRLSQDDIGCSSSQMSYQPSAPSPALPPVRLQSAFPLGRDGETSSVVGGGGCHSFRQMRRSVFPCLGPTQFSSNSFDTARLDVHMQRDQRTLDVGLSPSSGRPH